MEKNGSPFPEFITDEDHSFFITRLFIREGFADVSIESGNENDVGRIAPKTEDVIENYSRKRQKTAYKIAFAIMMDAEQTLEEIADYTGVSKRTVSRYMKELQNAGVLIREGSASRGKWILL